MSTHDEHLRYHLHTSQHSLLNIFLRKQKTNKKRKTTTNLFVFLAPAVVEYRTLFSINDLISGRSVQDRCALYHEGKAKVATTIMDYRK